MLNNMWLQIDYEEASTSRKSKEVTSVKGELRAYTNRAIKAGSVTEMSKCRTIDQTAREARN